MNKSYIKLRVMYVVVISQLNKTILTVSSRIQDEKHKSQSGVVIYSALVVYSWYNLVPINFVYNWYQFNGEPMKHLGIYGIWMMTWSSVGLMDVGLLPQKPIGL